MAFDELVKKGDAREEDIEDVREDLTGLESLRLVASVEVQEGKGRVLTVLTNQRLILMRRESLNFSVRRRVSRTSP